MRTRARDFALDLCLAGGFAGLHLDHDLAMRARRKILKRPDIGGAGIGHGVGFHKYRPKIIIFPDHEVHRIKLIIPIGYGVGDLAALADGFGGVLYILLFQGLKTNNLV